MRTSIVIAAVAAVAALPGTAHAAVVYSTGTTAYYQAGDGETNRVTVTTTADRKVVITDPGATITPQNQPGTEYPCTVSGSTATCPSAENYQSGLNVSLRDKDDTFTNQSGFGYPCYDDAAAICRPEVFVRAGDGADTLTGAEADETLYGDGGADVLNGNGGDDRLTGDDDDDDDGYPENAGNDRLGGGDGDDTLDGGPGSDSIDGGPGADVLGYSQYPRRVDGDLVFPTPADPGVTVTLDRTAATTGNGSPGENDTVGGVESLSGTQGADTLTGSDAPNEIRGSTGNDTITGRGGYDQLDGERGADTIDSRDNGPDHVDCGGAEQPGTVTGDVGDELVDCAAGIAALTPVTAPAQNPVQVPVPVPVPVPVADSTKAKLSKVTIPGSFKTSKLKSSGTVPVSFTPNENGVGEADLVGQAKSFAVASKAGDLVLASASKTAKANQKTTLKLKLAKKARKALRRKRKLTLRLAFTDKGGNVTTVSRRIKLK